MCATKTCASALPASAPALESSDRPFAATPMVMLIVDAFREALAMRRIAQKSVYLGDE